MAGHKKRTADLRRLGKLPPRADSRTLQLEKYLHADTSPYSLCAIRCHPERSKGSRLGVFASGQGTVLCENSDDTRRRCLEPAPPAIDWTAKVSSWPMMANDTLGDCTCAAAGHMIECWTANLGDAFTPSSAQIITAYSATSGYVVGDPSTDNGAVELDVLNYWRQQGIAGHKIYAYAAFDPRNAECARQAIALFGGAYIGLALPLSAQQQDVWDVPSFLSRIFSRFVGERLHSRSSSGDLLPSGRRALPRILRKLAGCRAQSASADECRANGFSSVQHLASSFQYAPGSWGGHAVPVLAYDSNGLTCITWGAKKRMTWDFFAQYCDEAYAPLSPDWLSAQGTDPAGLDFAQLTADLAKITS